MFLKLQGRLCVVVGGGPIAAQKAAGLLESGARVRVVSPTLDASWQALPPVEHIARPFAEGDCAGAVLVISATADDAVDARVVDDARAAGALVNTVDVPPRCDFYAGSVIRRGLVQVAISTAGASPSLAIAVRSQVERQLPEALGAFASLLADRRPALLRQFPVFAERAGRLNRAVAEVMPLLPAMSDALQSEWVGHVLACEHDCARAAQCCAAQRVQEVLHGHA